VELTARSEVITPLLGGGITDQRWQQLLDTRARFPQAVHDAYRTRTRPDRLINTRGTMFLVAADHPARGALGTGGSPLAMADRRGLLERLLTALEHPDVDGVLGSPDVIEELLLLGALEGKIVIGSMNRGGLDGASWTMDDRFTGYDARSIADCNLEGGKMLLRIDDDDRGTVQTLHSCAQAIHELGQRHMLAMIEPLPYKRTDNGVLVLQRDTASLCRAITVASALGTSSARTWLKMPACDDPETVYAATTLPCVVLGGVAETDRNRQLASWARTLRQQVVRGLVVGRTVLYPVDGDVTGAVSAAAQILRRAAEDKWKAA
jgi:hypothetical protein